MVKKLLLLGAVGLLLFFGLRQRQALTPSQKSPPQQSALPQKNTTPAVSSIQVPFTIPSGFKAGVFAQNLGKPRDLELSPGGTLLASIPERGQVVALPDRNQDGTADETKIILNKRNKPHGLAFFDGKLFVAEENQVVRYQWNEETLTATEDKVLFNLPAGGRHVTRTIAFKNERQLFVSIGSSCDVCNEAHEWLAAVIVSDVDGNNPRLWAKGLRNAVFITVNPRTQELWGTEMGRDFLGDNLPPEEINSIKDNKDYGWPNCYGNRILDTEFTKNLRFIRYPCADTEPPLYELPAHVAPLGLTFVNSSQFPLEWQGDLLVSLHGSWNSSVPVGYKVVRLNVEGNKVTGHEDFLAGFLPQDVLSGPQSALGRPVDLIFDGEGSLYISDDKAGAVYKVIGNQ